MGHSGYQGQGQRYPGAASGAGQFYNKFVEQGCPPDSDNSFFEEGLVVGHPFVTQGRQVQTSVLTVGDQF